MDEKIWFLDDEPSTRFPQYCRGNVGEVVPDVSTPLSSSILTRAFRNAFSEIFVGSGAFTSEELSEDSATGGSFGGYLYINMSFARVFARRFPGARIRDVDTQLLGSSSAPPYQPHASDRSLRGSLRALVGFPRSMRGSGSPDHDAARAETAQWLRSLPAQPTDDEIISVAAAYGDRFESLLRSHVRASLTAALPAALLERVTTRAERYEPGVLVRAISGFGTIETARPAALLWALGRRVAASTYLTTAFDAHAGDDLLRNLRANAAREADAHEFLTELDAFLDECGHRGPNEVELASTTWATAPASALAAIDRLRLAPETADPTTANARLATERAAAVARLREHTRRPVRPLLGPLLRAVARGAARREQAKGTIVLDLSGLRRMLHERADRLVAEGALADRRGLFMVTIDELPEVLRRPEAFASTIAARTARYDELNALIPPFAFSGMLPDPSTWERRIATDAHAQSAPGTTLKGIGVASGSATGTVRVVTDPSDPRGIEPGDVLVAPITDPAWTPLFLAASAVVVDVGALQSHAAIVARELGIPAVVSVEGATRCLADGTVVEVDGDAGVVRVLRSAPDVPSRA